MRTSVHMLYASWYVVLMFIPIHLFSFIQSSVVLLYNRLVARLTLSSGSAATGSSTDDASMESLLALLHTVLRRLGAPADTIDSHSVVLGCAVMWLVRFPPRRTIRVIE